MSDKRRRPWFQFHLSTAIVLMFAGGLILWANMRETLDSVTTGTTSYRGGQFEGTLTIMESGWPLMHRKHFLYTNPNVPEWGMWMYVPLAINVGINGAILLCICACSELFIRRSAKGLTMPGGWVRLPL